MSIITVLSILETNVHDFNYMILVQSNWYETMTNKWNKLAWFIQFSINIEIVQKPNDMNILYKSFVYSKMLGKMMWFHMAWCTGKNKNTLSTTNMRESHKSKRTSEQANKQTSKQAITKLNIERRSQNCVYVILRLCLCANFGMRPKLYMYRTNKVAKAGYSIWSMDLYV